MKKQISNLVSKDTRDNRVNVFIRSGFRLIKESSGAGARKDLIKLTFEEK